MPLNFPTSPTLNQTYTFNNKTWIWDGYGWALSTNGAINNIPVGNITPSTGAFTTLSATSFTTTGNVTATGNVTGGNILTAGAVSAGGNVTGGNVSSAALISGVTASVSGNITGGNILTAGQMSATANVTGGNILTAGQMSATGNITGGNVLGGANVNATTHTGTTVSVSANVTGGNLLTAGIVSAGGNVTGGNITTAGAVSAGGNVTGGNVLTAGQMSATGNVTGGNVSSAALISGVTASVSGNVTGGNLLTAGAVSATANVTGGNLLTAGQMSAGGNVTGGNVLTAGIVSATGNITANYFIGNGSLLTGISGGGGSGNSITNGNSNIRISTANGNATVAIAGLDTSSLFTRGSFFTAGPLATPKLIDHTSLVTDNVNSVLYGTVTIGANGNVYVPSTSTLTIGAELGNRIVFGNSSVGIATANGNVAVTVDGTANVMVISANAVVATANITAPYFIGNVTGGNIHASGSVNSNSVIISRQSTNQDAIALLGRAGGSGNYSITLTPETLSASRTVVIPDSGESSVTLGYREIPQNSESASYTLQYTDLGKHIYHPSADTTARTWIIPQTGTGVGQVDWPLGATISFINGSGAGVITIQVTSDTLRLAGPGTTGTRDIAANGIATCIKVTSTEWLISGTGIS